MFLFIVLINLIGFSNQDRQLGRVLTKPLNKRKPIRNIHLKFVDDLTVAESLKLKKQVIPNSDIEFRNRTEHIMPDSESQIIPLLKDILEYTESHKMKINCEKSKVMLFNTAKKWDFKPLIQFGEGDAMKIVENAAILGVQIQSNLKWNLNTDYICTRAYSRVLIVR